MPKVGAPIRPPHPPLATSQFLTSDGPTFIEVAQRPKPKSAESAVPL
jgi:hypothetical protein